MLNRVFTVATLAALAAASLALYHAGAAEAAPALLAQAGGLHLDASTLLTGLAFVGASNFVQSGASITFTAGADYSAGDVVRVGNLLGVVANDVANGDEGELQFGVFAVPKVSAAVIAAGETLTWDASAGAFDNNAATPATGDVTGAAAAAVEAAGNGVTELDVLFTGVPGTVT